MKKKLRVFGPLLLIPIVSAQSQIGSGLNSGVKNVIDIIIQFLGPFFAAILGGTQEMLFERVLVLAIVLSIVYMVASKIPTLGGGDDRNNAILWTVTITVSILSTRFISDIDYLKTIILPYSVLGVTLSSLIPFVIFWFFIESFDNKIVRKIGWIFFIVIFIGLWAARADELGSLSWIYIITAVLSFFFLLFDGTIREMIIKAEREAYNVQRKHEHLAKLHKELEELRKNERYWSSQREFNKAVRNLEKRIRRAQKAKF